MLFDGDDLDDLVEPSVVLPSDLSSVGVSEDESWLIRARYHLRMEEYWRDRAFSAEFKLSELKKSRKRENRASRLSIKKSSGD